MKLAENYEKYRWFFTSSEKLVVGGKSALQNDELLRSLKKTKKDFVVMHTSTPGSPFSVIVSLKKQVRKSDIEQAAVFTGCFSRAWRSGKKKAEIHVFTLSQLYKTKKMKAGTWGVKPLVKKKSVLLELVLAKQKGKLRAVPEKSVKKKDILLKIKPGKIDKKDILPKLQIELTESFSQEELLSALPSGGVAIVRK
jgi:hypothetical protein